MSARTDRLRGAVEEAARHSRLVLVGHEKPDFDALASCLLMRDLLGLWGLDARILLPTRADAQARRTLPRFGFDPDAHRGEICREDAILLLDHHEAPRVGRAVACVDHHLTAYPPNLSYVQIEPSGACAALVCRLLAEAGAGPTREQTALTCAALYLDTLALRSPKVLPEEIAWARETARALGMDEAWLEREGLNLTDTSLPADALLRRGAKRYEIAGQTVLSAQIQAHEMPSGKLEALRDAARGALKQAGAQLFVLLWNDPVAGYAVEYDLYEGGREKRVDHGRLVSRGRDVMPRVEKELTER